MGLPRRARSASLGALRRALRRGMAIPAHPLALTARRRLDERRQRALTRYYLDAGAGGVAIGVHTTQFAIRDPRHGLHRAVLELGADAVREWAPNVRRPVITVAGVCGPTSQAVAEAELARALGFQIALLSPGGLADWSEARLLDHTRAVAGVLPVMGFYLQPAVGGRPLSYRFWRRLALVERVVAIKIAPFNRYQTLDVARAVIDAGREREIALYTGNDDSILVDLLTTVAIGRRRAPIVGGLLGHWAFWTRTAVRQLRRCRRARARRAIPPRLLTLAAQVTDANGAMFDEANGFRGCIPGIHEILRRQGLLAGRWCLDPAEELSRGQMAEIDRVVAAYPHLADDRFVRTRLDRWLR
jgi:dihydrodipicolinate synthase/N-acetylneuraminate lyase